jgi:hypothetical protein
MSSQAKPCVKINRLIGKFELNSLEVLAFLYFAVIAWLFGIVAFLLLYVFSLVKA